MKRFFKEAKNYVLDFIRNLIGLKGKIDEGFSNAKFSNNVVVLVQGYSKSVKSIELNLKKPLEKLGLNVFVFNPGSSINKRIQSTSKELFDFVEKVCKKSEVSKVSLVAHSMGGLISLYYLEKLGGYKKVNKLIAAGTPFHGTRMAYLGIYSKAARQIIPNSEFLKNLCQNLCYTDKIISVRANRDQIIKPKTSSILEGAKNIQVDVVGHASLIRSDEFMDIVKKELK